MLESGLKHLYIYLWKEQAWKNNKYCNSPFIFLMDDLICEKGSFTHTFNLSSLTIHIFRFINPIHFTFGQ